VTGPERAFIETALMRTSNVGLLTTIRERPYKISIFGLEDLEPSAAPVSAAPVSAAPVSAAPVSAAPGGR
jgi:hypothetical protein